MSESEDIRRASTPRGGRYFDRQRYEAQAEAVFATSWQLLPPMPKGVSQAPFSLLPGMLDESLLQTRDKDDQIHCLSNVCTHRGMRLCAESVASKKIL